MTHICVGKLTIIGSFNGLSPERRQAIIWTNAELLLIEPLGTNFSEILIEIQTFSLTKIREICEMASILSRPQCVKIVRVTGSLSWSVVYVDYTLSNMLLNISYENRNCTYIYLLLPSVTIWWHRFLPLAQVTVCCMAAPNHYRHQCWLFFDVVLWD